MAKLNKNMLVVLRSRLISSMDNMAIMLPTVPTVNTENGSR